ncbi:MAG TPA: NAD(P)/FAD-dependent oxidoreductase [Rhodopila sp.]
MTTDIANQTTELDALVVGAGFAGLYQLLCLRDRLGLSVKTIEAGAGVGGTWYWNRYPGARCDSESHVYWYTFSPDLMREWEWSERYPGQPEIMRYLNHVADRFDLKRDILFNTRVTAAQYDETANRWRVRTENGETFVAKFLITAVGCLSTANVPAFNGLESFSGEWYHTGQWPHEGVDFTGKRVGMIGTGSTGIQAAPVIAAAAEHLTVFQRTANYSVPARNAPLTPEFRRYIKENAAEIRAVTRDTLNGMAFRIEERLAVETPPEEREAIYDAAWERGGLQFRAAFKDMMVDKAANDTAAEFVKRKIRSIVKDPKTAAILSDIDHPYAAKRPPIDTNYFETFNRANVTLVDVKATPIERISPAGVCTTQAEYPLDIIVFATGFDAMTGPLLRMNIQGRDGIALKDVWEAGRATTLDCRSRVFRTCLRSPVRAARRCCATCRWRSSSTQTGSPIASRTCARTGWSGSKLDPRRWTSGSRRSMTSPARRCCRWRSIPGISAPIFRASPRFSCRMQGEWFATGRSVTMSRRVAMKGSAWRRGSSFCSNMHDQHRFCDLG